MFPYNGALFSFCFAFYLGIDKFTIANGSIVKGEIWQLPSIKIGFTGGIESISVTEIGKEELTLLAVSNA